jgi:hypothetical protein
MKRFTFVPVLMAVALAATFAFAAQHLKSDLTPLAANGPTGKAEFSGVQSGQTQMSLQAKQLEANKDYTVWVYTDANCSVSPIQVGTFRSNPQGVGTFADRIPRDISQIGSVSINDASGKLACGVAQ